MINVRYTPNVLKRQYNKKKELDFGRSKIEHDAETLIPYCEKHAQSAEHLFSDETIKRTFGGHEKEQDWATWGGAASAIGGIGAGIATAVDVERKNEQIRQRNAQKDAQASRIASYAGGARGQIIGGYTETISFAKSIKGRLDKLYIGIKNNTQTLRSFLTLKITPTGGVRVVSNYQRGNIDGYLKITVAEQGEFILPLPMAGVPCNENGEYLGIEDGKISSAEPLVLWTVEFEKTEDNYAAYTVSDMEASPDYQKFQQQWNRISQTKKNVTWSKEQWKGCLTICFFMVLILLFVGAIVNIFATDGQPFEAMERAMMIDLVIDLAVCVPLSIWITNHDK